MAKHGIEESSEISRKGRTLHVETHPSIVFNVKPREVVVTGTNDPAGGGVITTRVFYANVENGDIKKLLKNT